MTELTLEKAAKACHEIWAHWMRYYLSRQFDQEDYARWRRQMNTPYPELSESEKASDRAVARLYMPLEEEEVRGD